MKGSVIVAGALAQKPHKGGHAWAFLQYLLGFRKLGWEVLFLDRLDLGMCETSGPQPHIDYLHSLMRGFDIPFALDYNCGEQWLGVPRAEVLARVRQSDFLINIMGFICDPEIMAAAHTRVFLDIDPGFSQMWQALGLADMLGGHDRYVTVGRNIGRADCSIPTCDLPWIPSFPPVILDEWPAISATGSHFTSVCAWRGSYGPVRFGNQIYGLRVHEFRKFAQLPLRTGQAFRLALDIHPDESRDLQLLDSGGWTIADPFAAAGDPVCYRRFIQASMAEIMIAKNMYVDSNSGWLSDRSACYLASGRPVLMQDTGFTGQIPTGEGIIAFTTLEQAIDGAASIAANWRMHSKAAQAIAEEYFDSDKVLSSLIDRLSMSGDSCTSPGCSSSTRTTSASAKL